MFGARFRVVVLTAVVSLTMGAFSEASAQSSGRYDNTTSFDVEHFHPMPSQGTNILNVGKSDVLPGGEVSTGAFLHFQDDSLLLETQQEDGEHRRLLDNQLKAEVWASFGIGNVFDFGVVVPFVLYQNTSELDLFDRPGVEADGGSLSDIRLVPKFRLVDPDNSGGLGLALSMPIYLPFGDTQSFNSDGAVRTEPRVIVDYHHKSGFVVALNGAYQFRPERTAQNYVSNDQVRWAIATEIPTPVDSLKVLTSLFGEVKPAPDRSLNNFEQDADENVGDPVEALAGLQYALSKNVVANAGGGAGITTGIGSPDFRVFASLGYTPRTSDSDDDGIDDSEDACETRPEDYDGFEDSDGCPDEDNDRDGVEDSDDTCPNEAEDEDGFEDADGCPDLDNDGDGLEDADDECPDEAEDVDEFEDSDGCPDLDNDGDGVADEEDDCPNTKGIAAANGCQPEDSDGDGLTDNVDDCPETPEDKDGFEDSDGCPDPDNDGDGVLDTNDKCPTEKEVINGVEDEDGCPDEGEQKVKVTEEKIEILERIYFDTGKSSIKERSYNILDQIASVLKANPQITKVRIEGHTDSRGDADYNKQLSQDRADAVREYLIESGIDETRLASKGYGEEQPIADNDTATGREKNRRVEFRIVEVDGEPVSGTDTVETEGGE